MAEEEDTREVLFPDWEGPDKTGLTIEQTGGEIYVKEVKGESPAARSGKVYEGDQIVGATIYFDNMSSEETAELLKTLNRHKVGLKLQNKGDKSPCYSPLSTPCRSPIGTLTWEGKTRFGGSSPDIILSGDDEDYKRIYTKKIKPRLKSEDLAEGVDVRTERHSSTSSDGSTITTITRRITTYTVDMPSGISEQLELSSPDFKGRRHESGDGSPRIRISHGSPSGKAGAEEGVFESSNVTYTGPQVSSTETRWGSGGVHTTTFIREGKERSTDVQFKGPNFGLKVSEVQEGIEMSRGSGEQGDGSVQVSETSMTLRDSTHTGSRHVTIAGLGSADIASTDENGGSISLSIPGKSMQISSTAMDKTQVGSSNTSLGDMKKVNISKITSSHPQTKGSGSSDTPNIRLSGGPMDSDTELRGGSRLGGTTITLGNAGSGFSSGPGKISVTGMDVNITGSKLKGDRDVDLPSTKEELKASGICVDADISLPVTHGEIQTSELDIKGTDMQIKGPSANIEGSVVSVRLPEAESDFKEPEINSNIQVKVPKSGSKYKMEVKIPSLSGPDKDGSMKGSKIVGNIDGTVSKADKEILAPKADSQGLSINTDMKEGDLKMSHIKMSSFGAKGQNVDVKAPKVDIRTTEATVESTDMKLKGPMYTVQSGSLPKIKGDTKGLNVDIKGAQINITGPYAATDVPTEEGQDIDRKLSKPNTDTTAPKVDIKSPGVHGRGPNVEMKGQKFTIPSTTVNVKAPQFDKKTSKVSLESPDVDIKAPKVDIGFKGPQGESKINVPSFGVKGPKVEGPDVDVNVPTTDIDIKAPEVDIKGANIDIESSHGKIKGPKFNMPTISGPKISMPAVDLNLKGPKLKGDVDVSVPAVEGDIKAPKLDIEGPDVDIEGGKGGFKMPKIKVPSFGVKGPKVEGPDVDVSLPTGDIDIKAPELDIKGPDIDIKSPSGKIKGPKFNMPTISGPKISLPDVDFNLKGPKLKGDVDVSVPTVEGDIKAPKLEIEGPDVDVEGAKGGFKIPKIKMPSFGGESPKVEGPDVDVRLPTGDIDVKAPEVDIGIESSRGKIKGPKFNMPKISGPKISMPDVDFNLKGPKLKGDVDMSVPAVEGDIKAPKLDIEGPDVDIEGGKGGFKMPKFKMPTFGGESPKVEGLDVGVSLPTADIDVKAPEVDIDIESSRGKIKGPKFNMPTISVPKISMPDVDFNLKGPKLKGDLDVSVPAVEGDIKAPKLDIERPDIDIECPKGGLKMPKFKLPSFGGEGPKVEGPDVDVSLPTADIDVKAPEVDIDIESSRGKIKGPNFNMPTISLPKISMPDMDLNLKGPQLKGDVDVSAPAVEGDIKAPKLDIEGPDVDIEGGKGGFKMPKFKVPSFGFKGPKVEGPDVDVRVPTADIDIEAPEVDIKGPDIDIKSPSGKIKGPKLNMPTISGPKISMPDMDFNLKGPKLKGDVDVSAPKIEADLKTSSADIKIPKIDIEGSKGGFEMPKIKTPSLNIKGPKAESPDIDINLPKSNIDLKTPNLDINLKTPKVKGDMDASVPKFEGDVKGPNAGFDVDLNKSGVTFPKFKGPKFATKSAEVEGSESTVKTPKFTVGAKGSKTKVTLPETEASLDAPNIDINIKGKKGKFKLPKVKGNTKKPNVDIETPALDVDLETPNIHVKGTKAKKPLFGKLHFPDVELDIKSPKVKGDTSERFKSPDIDLPSASLNTDSANVCLEEPDVKVKTPDIKMSGLKGGPEVNASVSGGSATGGLQYPEGTVKFPKLKVPKFGIALPQTEGQGIGGKVETELAASSGMNIQSPSFSYQVSSQNIDVPSPELRQSEGKVKVKMPKLFGKSKAKGSSVGDLTGPEVELTTGGKVSKASTSSVHSGELMGGKFELEGDPGLSVSTKGKSASLDLFKKSRHRSSSLSDEGGLAVSSPSAHLEAEGGDISLDLGGGKVKGKKGKLKFGTFGGFGSKSKGSYEVTLGDSEAGVEGGAGVSLPSKKSRLSSSSSSDSGSRGGFRFPRLELSMSPKK